MYPLLGWQCVSRRMPQHVDMHRERQSSGLASPFNHPSNAHAAEGLATLIAEYVGPLDAVSLLLPVQKLETVHLVPLQVVDAVSAALEPANDDGPLRQVDVIPTEIASLRHAQTVAIDDQSDQPIPVIMPVVLEGGQQLVHFCFGQVLANPIDVVRQSATGRITISLTLAQLHDFRRHCWAPEWLVVA